MAESKDMLGASEVIERFVDTPMELPAEPSLDLGSTFLEETKPEKIERDEVSPGYLGLQEFGKIKRVVGGGGRAGDARMANIMGLSDQLGVPPSWVADRYEELSNEIITRDRFNAVEAVMSGGILAALMTNPATTMLGIAGYEALPRLTNAVIKYFEDGKFRIGNLGDKYSVAERIPGEASDNEKALGELFDVVYASMGAMGAGAATRMWSRFTKEVIGEVKGPNSVFISPEAFRSIPFEEAWKFEGDLFGRLGISKADIASAVELGMPIEIPSHAVVYLADTPWWAAIKQGLHIDPYRRVVGFGPAETALIGSEGASGPAVPRQLLVDQIAAAMKQVESGGDYGIVSKDGGRGAYQFTGTWDLWSSQYAKTHNLGDRPLPFTPENQDAVAKWKINEYLDKGYSLQQIAAAWNAGEGALANDRWKTMVGVNAANVRYDVPEHVRKVEMAFAAITGGELPAPTASAAPPKFTREDLVSSLDQVQIPSEQKTTLMELWDAMDEAWTKTYNLRPGEWYEHMFAGLKVQDESALREFALKQAGYHGSPYQFERFDFSKMGSGEGAQAYGWGGYIAGRKGTGEFYREKLSETEFYLRNKKIQHIADTDEQIYGLKPEEQAAIALAANAKDRVLAKRWLEAQRDYAKKSEFRSLNPNKTASDVVKYYQDSIDALDTLDISDVRIKRGQLYKVDIPENEDLLYWDKPLSEQSEKVKSILSKDKKLDEWLNSERNRGEGKSFLEGGYGGMTGSDLYEELSRQLGQDRTMTGGWTARIKNAEAASKYLQSIGIPGHRYLDQASRAVGEGTHNYVIYDEDAIKILETYYQKALEDTQETIVKGAAEILKDLRGIIHLFEKAGTPNYDISTLIEESFHILIQHLRGDDLRIMNEWLGAEPDAIPIENWTTEQQEQAARGFQAYLFEGKAPSSKLREVFAKIRRWLLDIYKTIKRLGVELTDEVRGVFDRLVSTAEERENNAVFRVRDEYDLIKQQSPWQKAGAGGTLLSRESLGVPSGGADLRGELPFDSDSTKLYQLVKVKRDVSVNRYKAESRIYEVSIDPSVLAKMPDRPPEIDIQTVDQAREINASPERVRDWQKLYDQATKITDYSKASKGKITAGKLVGLEVIGLTSGCQRALTTVERAENGILPSETRTEACYGGDCWVNKQFNAAFGDFENMEVRDLAIATKEAITKWLSKEPIKKKLREATFIRQGYFGDDSHAIASGIVEHWLSELKKAGITTKNVFISAGYGPVTDAQYASLKPYADQFELHFSNSGWFHKNEILLRLGEYFAAKKAGLPAKIRLITNKDNISGVSMQNHDYLSNLMVELGVPQEDVLETPFHDDALRGKKGVQDRSNPTNEWQNVCCETGKCATCKIKCLTKPSGVKENVTGDASVETSFQLKSDTIEKPKEVKRVLFQTETRTLDEYDRLMAEASRKALANVEERRRKTTQKRENAWARQAREVVRQDPVQSIKEQIVKRGGLNASMLSKDYSAETIKALNAKRPGLVTKTGKMESDIVAVDYGFESQDEMINAILDGPTLAEAVESQVEFFREEFKAESEAEALEDMILIMDEEIKVLRELTASSTSKMQNFPAKGLKEVIRRNTGQIKVDEASMVHEHHALKASMEAAARAARTAYNAGKKEEALNQKIRQRAIAEKLRDKRLANIELKKLLREIEKFASDKKLPWDYRKQIQDQLEPFSFKRRSEAQESSWEQEIQGRVGGGPEQYETFNEWVARLEEEGELVNIDPKARRLLDRLNKIPLNHLSIEDIRVIHGAIKHLHHLGTTKGKLLAAKQRRDLDAVAGLLGKHIVERARKVRELTDVVKPTGSEETWMEKLTTALKSVDAEMIPPEYLIRMLDAGEDNGFAWQQLKLPVEEAFETEMRMMKQIESAFTKAFGKVEEKKLKQWAKQKYSMDGFPELLRLMTKQQMIMLVSNSFHPDNLKALRTGYGLTDDQIAQVRSMLTAEEMELVKDLIEVWKIPKKSLFDTHMTLTGSPLKEVQGVYFPLKFDPKLSDKMAEIEAEKQASEFFKDFFPGINVKAGAAHERTGGKAAPLLQFKWIPERLHETAHYGTHAVVVRDLLKLLKHPHVKNAILRSYGKPYHDHLLQWLKRVANPRSPEPPLKFDRIIDWTRQAQVTYIMFWRLSTALQQPLALMNTMAEVGTVPVLRATAQFMRHPRYWSDYVNQRDENLANRSTSYDREIQETFASFDPANPDWYRKTVAIGQILTAFTDGVVAKIGWLAAYKEAMAGNVANVAALDEQMAIRHASSVVIRTQASGSPKDRSTIMNKTSPVYKAFVTFFFSYLNNFYGYLREQGMKLNNPHMVEYGWLDFLKAMFLTVVLGGMAQEVISKGPNTTMKDVLQAPFRYPLMTVPFVRDITSVLFDGYDYRGGLAGNLVNEFKRFMGAVTKATPNKEAKRVVAGLRLVGRLTGLPPDQAVLIMENIVNRRVRGPESLIYRERRKRP